MAVLVSLVEGERSVAEGVCKISQRGFDAGVFCVVDQSDAVEGVHVSCCRLDIEQEDFTIENHVVAAHEAHRVVFDNRAGLGPEWCRFGFDAG